MPRLPRALTARIQRRRDARAPHVVVRDRTGIPRVLDPPTTPPQRPSSTPRNG